GLLHAERREPAAGSSGDPTRAEARRAAHLPRVLAPRGRLAAPAVRLVFVHLAAMDRDQGLRGHDRRLSVSASLDPLLPRSERAGETAVDVSPDLVCFSWRDIQIFSPHEGDASLEQAFTFYYSPNPFKKLAASLSGLKSLYQYYSGIRANLANAWLIRKICPGAQIMI